MNYTKIEVSGDTSAFTCGWNSQTGALAVGSSDDSSYYVRLNQGLAAGEYELTLTLYHDRDGSGATHDWVALDTATVTATIVAVPTYTVTFHANGGSGAPAAQTKTHDAALTLTDAQPTRTGYAFLGWATSANGTVAYAPGADYTGNENVTLYAVWLFNGVDVESVVTGETVTITLQKQADIAVTAFVAGYGTDNDLNSGVEMIPLTEDAETVTIQRTNTMETVKILLLDENFAPLAPVQYIELP